MKTRILMVGLGIAWVAALAGLLWMMTLGGMRPHHAIYVLIDLDIVLKACAVLSVASVVIGLIRGAATRGLAP